MAGYTKGCVQTIKFHYPAVVTTVGNSLDKPVGLAAGGGVAFVSEHFLKYFDAGGQVQLRPKRLDKAALEHALAERQISSKGKTVKQMRQRPTKWLVITIIINLGLQTLGVERDQPVEHPRALGATYMMSRLEALDRGCQHID